MTITGTTGGIGTRAVSKRYPVEEGLSGGTTLQKTESPKLEVQEQNLILTNQSWGCA
jgi:hypothetical protein